MAHSAQIITCIIQSQFLGFGSLATNVYEYVVETLLKAVAYIENQIMQLVFKGK